MERIISYVVSRVEEWESGMPQFFGLWNEWSGHYEMKFQDKDPRPAGISKNVLGEFTRGVNTIADTLTTMQTASDPPFELRAKNGVGSYDEGRIFEMESHVSDILTNVQYVRYLEKGNRGMACFGTQIWEKPLVSFPPGSAERIFEGTALRPLSLLQVAFNPEVYDMDYSDHMTPVMKINKHILRDMANSGDGVWNTDEVEKAIDECEKGSETGYSDSHITQRRTRAGYNEQKASQLELILYNGRVSKEILESQEFQEMWQKFGRTDDPKFCDITIGVLNRKYLVRMHPTPYRTWKHLYGIGHYIEWELEPLAHGVGSLTSPIQKEMNKIARYISDVGKFNLFSMMLAGRGSGLKSGSMNIFPFAAINVDDVSQIKPLQPNVDGIRHGIELLKLLIEDGRGVSQASSTLQAVLTGATATESTLAQSSSMRSMSLCARINSDSVIRPYFRGMITNLLDQNPYDSRFVPVEVVPKLTTDKDYKPEYAKKLLEFLNFITTIRNVMPIDLNPQPIIETLARSMGINPRLLNKPRPQIDRMLDIMRRINNQGGGKDAMATEGELAGAGVPDGNVQGVNGEVTNAPMLGAA
jgi:hypothetical protein